MQNFPHHYLVTASGQTEGSVLVSSKGLPNVSTAAPPEFDGPEGYWSPETLLMAAVADCFILTFRAIARASNLAWSELTCKAHGVLDRVERVTKFTEIHIEATLTMPPGSDTEKARRLLEKAEQGCLISNSLSAQRALKVTIEHG